MDLTLTLGIGLEEQKHGLIFSELVSKAENLKKLKIENAILKDLSPLMDKSIETLKLVNCKIEDISILSNNVLNGFCDVELDLSCNFITDISPLPAQNYKYIYLSRNPITDFSRFQVLSGDCVEISFANTDDFVDQLDYFNGFSRIIILHVPIEIEGLIKRKLDKMSFKCMLSDHNSSFL